MVSERATQRAIDLWEELDRKEGSVAKVTAIALALDDFAEDEIAERAVKIRESTRRFTARLDELLDEQESDVPV